MPGDRPVPSCTLSLHASPWEGHAHTRLQLHLANPWPAPLTAGASLPLPVDAALLDLHLLAASRRLPGRPLPRAQARELFHRELNAGATACLLDPERPGRWALHLANLAPEAEGGLELSLAHPLLEAAPGWEYRFPLAGGPARRASLSLAGQPAAELPLDRDAVARLPGQAAPLSVLREGDLGLLRLTAPAGPPPGPREVMVIVCAGRGRAGPPALPEAVRLASRLLRDLGPLDRLELLAYAEHPARWQERPVLATPSAVEMAQAWLRALEPGGEPAPELALREALRRLRFDARTQLVLLTDGAGPTPRSGWESLLRGLPERARLHVVALGPAPDRTQTHALARAGRGRELFWAGPLSEPVEAVAQRVLQALAPPALCGLSFAGSALAGPLPAPIAELGPGQALRLPLRLASGGGELWLRGTCRGEGWEQRLEVPASAGETALRERLARADAALRAGPAQAWVASTPEAQVRGSRKRVSVRLPYVPPPAPAPTRAPAPAPAAAPVPVAPAPTPAPPAPESARLVAQARHRRGVLRLEFAAADLLAWVAPHRVRLELADGTSIEAPVLREQSSPPGRLAAGGDIWLAVRVQPGLEVRAVILPNRPEPLRLELA